MTDWRLRVMSFRGLVPGASHWTATIRSPRMAWSDPEIEVETLLTEPRMSDLNRAERRSGHAFRYEPGVECGRYMTREDVIEAAKQVFEQHAEVGDRLIHDLYNDQVYAEKQPWAPRDRVMPNPRNGYHTLTEEQWALRGTVGAVHRTADGHTTLHVVWDGAPAGDVDESWYETDEVVRVLAEQVQQS